MKGRYYFEHLIRDILVIVGSVIVAVYLFRLGIIENFVANDNSPRIISAFIAGMFFTSVFTVAPAAVALVAIGESFSLVLTAFFGALGALVLDMFIISFIRNDITKDLDGLVEKIEYRRPSLRRFVEEAFRNGVLKWAALVFGVLIVASPLPDEFGLLLIGLSKINTWKLAVALFAAHFLGILALTSIISLI